MATAILHDRRLDAIDRRHATEDALIVKAEAERRVRMRLLWGTFLTVSLGSLERLAEHFIFHFN